MTRLRTSILVAIAVLAAAPPAGAVHVRANPRLSPPFGVRIHDYVSRCIPGKDLRLTVKAGPGERVSVDGRRARGGSFHAAVHLEAGQGTTVRSGRAGYHIRCLPPGFPTEVVTRRGRPSVQWYLITLSEPWVTFFDSHGTPVWWKLDSRGLPFNPTLLSNGHVAWFPLPANGHFGVWSSRAYVEHTLTGTAVRRIATQGVPTDIHELRQLPNGDFMLDAYRPRDGVDLRPYGGPRNGRVYDGEIQEVTPGGKLVWRWNSHGHIALSETGRWWGMMDLNKRVDLMHTNAIAPDGDGVIVSFRHTDAIYRIDRRTGRIDWKLGGTRTSRSLTIVGDRFADSDFGGQHDVRLLPDGTVTLYDNGSSRGRRPRALRFRIDTSTRTATLLEDHHDAIAKGSTAQGSARRLPDGHWAVSWGGTPVLSELTAGNRLVWRLKFRRVIVYRLTPVPFGTFSAPRLRRAMDRMNPRG